MLPYQKRERFVSHFVGGMVYRLQCSSLSSSSLSSAVFGVGGTSESPASLLLSTSSILANRVHPPRTKDDENEEDWEMREIIK